MKNLLIVFFLLLSITAFSQFRMVGTATWSTLNDSTYQGTVSFQSDLTGMGYLATHIVDTFRLFTPVEKIYRIDSVWNKTFSSATLRIVEMLGTQGVPVGQVMVFNPDGRNTIPQNPFGSTGATAQLNAAVDTWNARQIGTGGTPNNGKCLERQHTQAGHAFSIGDAVFWDADTLKLASVNSLLPAQAVVTGFVPDSDILIIAYTGECETTLTHGFTQDSAYYVSRTGGQPVIEGSKPDTSQYLFRALNDSTIVVAIGNMYLEGSSGSNVATSTYKYCNTGTSCLSDSTYTQIYSTVDTVLLGTPTYNGELRCFDNQTVGSVVLKPENVATTEIAGDAVYSLPSGQSICFYASPNGAAAWNWYIVSEGNVPATPGIDSSVVRNDSVFLVTTGGELFSGLADAPRPNNGRVWYVSKSNPACSASAVVGDPTQPFCNPWQAIDSVQSGDIVHVFPATFYIGGVNSDNRNLTKRLYFNGTWFFEKGARIICDTSVNTVLFSVTNTSLNLNGQKMNVLGNLSINHTNLGGSAQPINIITNNHIGRPDFYLEFDSVILNTATAFNFTDTVGSIFVKANIVENGSTCVRFRNLSDATIEIKKIVAKGTNGVFNISNNLSKKMFFKINVDELVYQKVAGNSIWRLDTGQSDSMTIDCNIKLLRIDKNATFNLPGGSGEQSKFLGQSGGAPISYFRSIINFNIDNIRDESLDTNAIFTIKDYFKGGSIVNFNINTGYSVSGGIFNAAAPFYSPTDSMTVNFNIGTFRQYNNKPSFRINQSAPLATININVKNLFSLRECIVIENSASYNKIEINSSRMQSLTQNTINLNSQNIDVVNSRLIAAPGFAPVIGSGNISCMNVFSNSLTTSSTVELVQPITRNSNVK